MKAKRKTRARSTRNVGGEDEDGPPFGGVLGDSSELRILRELLSDPTHDYMKLELARDAGVTRTTLDRVWSTFLEHDMVHEVRKLGRIRTYRINAKHPLVRDLARHAVKLARSPDGPRGSKRGSRASGPAKRRPPRG
jgi:DNA-binding transcriptional ArsR family regulator